MARKSNYQRIEELRKRFTEDYPIEAIKSLTLEDYAVGTQRHDTFCYRIEYELKELGNMSGSYANKFGVWHPQGGKAGEYACVKKFSSKGDALEGFEAVKAEIVKLLDAGKEGNLSVIKSSRLSGIFMYKLLSVYYPEEYVPIFVEEHYEYFLKKIGVDSNSSSILDMQEKLKRFKDSREIFNGLSLLEFSNELYALYGKPTSKKARSRKKDESDISYEENSETARTEIAVRERNSKARAACLKARGAACAVCGFVSEEVYGENYKGLIEVHHIVPISERKGRYKIDPKNDLIPLCPNCHAAIHRSAGGKMLTPDELKSLVDNCKK